jgi:hypothetical protein
MTVRKILYLFTRSPLDIEALGFSPSKLLVNLALTIVIITIFGN